MKKNTAGKICVFTKDNYLFQKIKLDAPKEYEVILSDGKNAPNADLYLCDADTSNTEKTDAVLMSRYGNGDMALPFPLGTIEKMLTKKQKPLELSQDDRCAVLYGERIKLTEVEFSLLSLLYSHGGSYASREEVLSKIWYGEADSGVINVYIHYLREKLEKRGEKIILSSRRNGYCIDKKFLGGEENA